MYSDIPKFISSRLKVYIIVMYHVLLRVFILLYYVLIHLTRLWHFSSSVNSFFKRACAAVGLAVWFLVGHFVYFHTSCVWTAKALARLHRCAGLSEPLLVAYVISTIISWAGLFYFSAAPSTSNCCPCPSSCHLPADRPHQKVITAVGTKVWHLSTEINTRYREQTTENVFPTLTSSRVSKKQAVNARGRALS